MNKGYTPTGFLNEYNPIEKIICAAMWIKGVSRHKDFNDFGAQPYNINEGVVIFAWRHNGCFAIAKRIWDLDRLEIDDGFLTSHNRYVNRKEAAKIATQAGQIKRDVGSLSSEDLY